MSHHHACSNPKNPLALPGSPPPCAPCATLLLLEGWACEEQVDELGAKWSGEGLQSRPMSLVPITQAEKNKVFFFESQTPQRSTVTWFWSQEWDNTMPMKDIVWFLLFAKAFLAITSNFSTCCHFFVSLCTAISGFSFRALHKKALFAFKSLFLDKILN